jgi:hypothetical protein
MIKGRWQLTKATQASHRGVLYGLLCCRSDGIIAGEGEALLNVLKVTKHVTCMQAMTK